MERQNPDTPRGCGRGRPVENNMRRPFTTYANESGYVPAEGSNSGLRLSMGDMPRHDIAPNGEPGLYYISPEDHGNMQSGTPNRVVPEVKSILSPYAPEFVPRNFNPVPRVVPPTVCPTVDTSSDSYSIQELRNFLYDITLCPGKFESKIQPLIDTLNDYVDDDDALRAIVNIIFDESVRQSNFRYNGARLCKYLCDELQVSSERQNFKQLLLSRCNQEHKRREYLAESDDGGAYLRGFIMYMAELFLQLERLPVFADYIMSTLETIINHPTSENLKCICQVMKLVGVYLEDMEKAKLPNSRPGVAMENIVNSLKAISRMQDLPRDVRCMVSKVVEMQARDWGRMSDSDSPGDEAIPQSSSQLNEPVMYGPDGKPITAEESQFLHSQYSYHASDAEEYDAYEDNGEEMEEEMQADYEVFLNEITR